MEDCVFCKIRDGEMNSKKLFENEYFFIIEDIDKKAKCHYLAIPKIHFKLLSEMHEKESVTINNMLNTIPTLTEKLGLKNGYRLIINQGNDAGQSVPHLHIHILGGEELGWTPA